MLYRLMKLSLPVPALPLSEVPAAKFADEADISSWAVEAVQALAAAGVIEGNQAGKLLPKQEITRAEIAKIASFFAKQ